MPSAKQITQPSRVIGPFEEVMFPGFGTGSIKAKVDTGAYSGALHCVKIQKRDGVLFFTPLDGRKMIKSENFAVKYVTSSNGKRQRRYFVSTIIRIRGVDYPIVISLTSRDGMRWPVLIGRKFLRQHKFFVDAGRTNS
jgi:hypothetical protein